MRIAHGPSPPPTITCHTPAGQWKKSPDTQPALLALDEQRALAVQDEERLLDALRVVQAVRLARLDDVHVDAEVREVRVVRLEGAEDARPLVTDPRRVRRFVTNQPSPCGCRPSRPANRRSCLPRSQLHPSPVGLRSYSCLRWPRSDLVAREVEVAGRRLSLLVPRSADDLLDEVAGRRRHRRALLGRPLALGAGPRAHLLEGDDLAGRRVLELGCGVGLPSVAALLAGADVLATDNEPAAVRIAARNARRCGGRRMATMVVDVLDPPDELLELAPFDLVIAADVMYEEQLPTRSAACCRASRRRTARRSSPTPSPVRATASPRRSRRAGWQARTEEELVPGWREGQTTVRLLRLRPAG